MPYKTNIAVLISGNGSNLQALIDACANEDFPAKIGLVISNKGEAYGLKRAETANIPVCVISHRDFADRNQFDEAMHQKLLEYNIEMVCLAGFMRLLTPDFTAIWEGRMLNIHPSLLPAYKGLETHARVLQAGETQTGATVHYVVAEMDAGEIILQQAVDIAKDDTTETLQQKVHQIEHIIYPKALKIAALKYQNGK